MLSRGDGGMQEQRDAGEGDQHCVSCVSAMSTAIRVKVYPVR